MTLNKAEGELCELLKLYQTLLLTVFFSLLFVHTRSIQEIGAGQSPYDLYFVNEEHLRQVFVEWRICYVARGKLDE